MRCEEARSRARAVAIGRAVLLDWLDVIRAAWQLGGLRHDIAGMEDDADFWTMVALTSQTGHLPLGSERAYWQEEVRASCKRIVDRLGPDVYGPR